MALSNWLFDPSGLTPHGFCLTWEPGLLALHAGSDALTGLAYLSIPLALASFARQRRDLQYLWVVYPFVGFIMACAMTHVLAVLTLWVPVYGIEGLVKAATAALSVATAVLLWPLIPRLVALPSPAQLARLNTDLSASIAQHERTSLSLRQSEARGRAANAELERRVAERTADLREANQQLTAALAERAEALRALAHREAEFRASFEGASVGKVLAEPRSRRILRANRAFARMLGFEPEDLVGRTTVDVTHQDDAALDAADYERLLSGGTDAIVHEARYTRRDGTTFWARVSTTLARVPASDHSLLVAAIEDIDARHRSEAGLLAANRRLEEVVEERTAALGQRDLLLREVYHRVKNNLQIVDSLLAMQHHSLEHQEGKDALRALRGRLYALGLAHHQLMRSSNLKTFDIAPFLHELSKNILDSGSQPGIDLMVEASCLDVGLDFAIPMSLVVTELVTNSLQHAFPDGVGTIRVVLKPVDHETLRLIVSDDGAGPRHGGSGHSSQGLGNRIVRRLVTQLEGTMIVRHAGGTTTDITVPMPLAS